MTTSQGSRIPDNTVEYFLYLNPAALSSPGKDVTSELDNRIVQYCAHLAPFLADYIWQKEPFTLRSIINDSGAYIYGRTNFEDNIEDEYFIIFLLRQLTLFDTDLVARIEDEDGEILLIESAQCLDKWAQDPSRTTKRAYLFNGEIHLISPTLKPNWTEHDSRKWPIEAACYILSNSFQTRCNDAIQQCLIKRTSTYPSNIRVLQHRAHCYLPVSIVSLLEHNPKFISNAVRAFYYRTLDDQKIVASMKHFSEQNCIFANTKFTRCLFAQLTSQEYTPDKRCNWPIPPKEADNYNVYINGFKVTAGFEIILSRFLNGNQKVMSDSNNDVSKHALWPEFISYLENKGYFEDAPVGSNLCNQKMQKCKLFFENTTNFETKEYDIEKEIYDYIQKVNIDEELNKRSSAPLEPEDDSNWLFLNQNQLDSLLAEKFGCSSTNEMNLEDISKSIPETIKKFVFNEKSGLKGAEAPKAESKNFKNGKSKIEFNEAEFSNFVKEIQFLVEKKPNIDDFLDGDTTDSSSLEDYGSDDEDDFGSIDNANQRSNSETQEIKAYLQQMDSELAKTLVGQSFKKSAPLYLDSDDDDDDTEKDCSTEMDLNVLSNILESYSGESEMATSVGPATALFSTMGTKLPDIDKRTNQ